jgi:hypothetical protein
MSTRQIRRPSPQLVERVLGASDDTEVLVGGQALAIWVARYGLLLPDPLPVITHDADFLTQSADAKKTVLKFAEVLKGKATFPRRLALTSLVGQVELEVSDSIHLNIDVIFRVVGLDAASVLARALRMSLGTNSFLVMHPFDVLHNRVANLHVLRDKQNEKGTLQLALGIQVARAFLQAEALRFSPAQTATGRSPVQTLVSELERLALSDAGRKVAARWGQHVADAIDPSIIPAGRFWTHKWPALRTLMSSEHAKQFKPPESVKPGLKSIPKSAPRKAKSA